MRLLESKIRIEEKISRELGPEIQEQLNDPRTTEIALNPDGSLWVQKMGTSWKEFGSFNQTRAESLICSVASYLGTEITEDSPSLECEFPLDGSRFSALLPPIVTGPSFTLRRQALRLPSLTDYVEDKIMSPKQLAHLDHDVLAKRNILVVGSTASGKTTLANALLNRIAELCPEDRMLVIEDTREIRSQSRNLITMKSTLDVSYTDLLRFALRFTPDRISVGEVRGPEALSLLKAWNTGHSGGICTVHANDALSGLLRIEQLVSEVTERPMQAYIAQAVNTVIVIRRTPHGRIVSEFMRVHGFEGRTYSVTNLE